MPNANTWTCETCGAVYHDLDAVEAHAGSGDGHVLFDATYRPRESGDSDAQA